MINKVQKCYLEVSKIVRDKKVPANDKTENRWKYFCGLFRKIVIFFIRTLFIVAYRERGKQ
jgi:hypothetical protein